MKAVSSVLYSSLELGLKAYITTAQFLWQARITTIQEKKRCLAGHSSESLGWSVCHMTLTRYSVSVLTETLFLDA